MHHTLCMLTASMNPGHEHKLKNQHQQKYTLFVGLHVRPRGSPPPPPPTHHDLTTIYRVYQYLHPQKYTLFVDLDIPTFIFFWRTPMGVPSVKNHLVNIVLWNIIEPTWHIHLSKCSDQSTRYLPKMFLPWCLIWLIHEFIIKYPLSPCCAAVFRHWALTCHKRGPVWGLTG